VSERLVGPYGREWDAHDGLACFKGHHEHPLNPWSKWHANEIGANGAVSIHTVKIGFFSFIFLVRGSTKN
jgi:hypothetical protein